MILRFLTSLPGHLSNVWHGLLSVFAPRYSDAPFERIVFVCGIHTRARQLHAWERHIRRAFAGVSFVPVRHYYLHINPDETRAMIAATRDILSPSDEKTLIIAHSFGGLIAKAALEQVERTDHIVLLATLASPHAMGEFGVREACTEHAIPAATSVPTLTFGGRLDVVVPDLHTHMEGERSHITLTCTHVAFLWLRRTRQEVLSAIMVYLRTR